MPITLTERAACELKDLMATQNQMNSALRVWVAGGGCSGLQYGMALDELEPESGDQIFTDRDVRIFVDEMSLRYMDGAVVDFVDDNLGGGFKIENPNAVTSCGCGSSFQTEDSGGAGGGGCGSCGHRG